MKGLIKGVVTGVTEVTEGTSSKGAWKKQSIVVRENGDKFETDIAVELWNDNVGKASPGQTVECDVDVTSREYNGKYYTNVKAWKVTASGDVKPVSKKASDDGLPF
jgi:hypothetical protein